MGVRRQLALALIGLAGCEQRPPLEWHGEHVRIGTDVVDQVCGGSIARMDYAAAHVGERLGLGPPDQPHEIWILAPQSFADACRDAADVVGCSAPRKGVVLRAQTARTGVPHELAHERVRDELGTRRKPFFEEGIAEAMQGLPCEVSGELPSHDQLLGARSGIDLGVDGYCYAGRFVDWLLETDGPTKVLEFHDVIDSKTEPSLVRAYYYSYFWRTLEGDLSAPLPAYDGDAIHCFAPELEREASGHYRRMLADTTCSNARVENDFATPERVYVEWQLTITPEEAGYWQLVGELPSDAASVYPFVELAPSLCGSSGAGVNARLLAAGKLSRARLKLAAGSYWVRLIGKRDAPVDVDLWFSGPCDYGRDSCRAGHRCDGEVCIPKASNPLPLGAACSASALLGDPCDDGLRCVGGSEEGTTYGWCTALCSSDADCPLATICHGNGLCGAACESETQCDSVESCVPGSFGSPAACLPSGDVNFGGACERDTDCADDRVCHDPGVSATGCSDPLAGCFCTLACELADPGCPVGTHCALERDGSRATCQTN